MMKLLIAKVNGVEIDRKKVAEASPLAIHQFIFEVSWGVTKEFRDKIKIEVK